MHAQQVDHLSKLSKDLYFVALENDLHDTTFFQSMLFLHQYNHIFLFFKNSTNAISIV
jgi:hypothetical protein